MNILFDWLKKFSIWLSKKLHTPIVGVVILEENIRARFVTSNNRILVIEVKKGAMNKIKVIKHNEDILIKLKENKHE